MHACRHTRTHTHTRKLDRVWIIIALVQSVQSLCALGSKTHLVFLLYRASPFVMACAVVLSVFVGVEKGCVLVSKGIRG